MYADDLDLLEAMTKHRRRAEELCGMADDWIAVDDETLARRGLAGGNYYIELAKLHLALRELYRQAQ